MTDEETKVLGEKIAGCLCEIEEFFAEGVKLTLLARNPGLPDSDVLVSADDFPEIMQALASIQSRSPIQLGV